MVKKDFQQTEVGKIPKDWKVKKIKEFTDATSGGTPSTFIPAYWNGDIRWMNSGEVNLKKIYDVKGRITKLGLKNSSTKLIPKNCVLIGLAGQGKTRGTVAINYVELCVNQSVGAILPNQSFVSEYLYYNLDSRYSELRNLSTGEGGRGGLNITIIRNIPIPLPPTIEEQSAIAQVLLNVDKLLEQLDNLIDKKKNIKQGSIQELVVGKRRLSGFSDDWKVIRLGNILNVRHGKSQKKIEDENGIFPILGSGGEIGKTNSFLYDKPSVLIGRKGNIDRPQFMDSPFWSIDTLYFTEISDEVNPKFIFYLFCQINWLKYNESSGRPSLTTQNIENIEVKIPKSIKEQTAIAQILSDMDLEIEKLQIKRNKYLNIKQGIMQKLLTGVIRLK